MVPKVSIIITIYNREKYIETCVRSLFEQTLVDLEFIFVNDASTDNSIEIVNNVISQYPERKSTCKIINLKTNGGVSNARRIGMENVTGEYVIHTDSDDWVDEDMYERLYQKAKENNADIVGCDICHEYINNRKYLKQNYGVTIDDNISRLIRGDIHPSLCTSLTRTRIIKDNDIKFPDGLNMGEDLFYNLQLYNHANLIIGMDFAPYHYRHTVASSSFHHTRETIDSGIMIGRAIEEYMRKIKRYDDFSTDIEFRKFSLKLALMQNFESKDNYHYWLNVFPETNKHIWNYKQLDKKLRFELWIASKGRFELARFTKKALDWQHNIRKKIF